MKIISERFSIDLRSFLTIAILFSTLAGLGLYFMYTTDIASLVHSRRITEKMHNEMTSRVISKDLSVLFTDIQLVATHVEVRSFLKDRDELARRKVEEEFLTLCEVTKAYDQVRLIDTNGMELVRVNYNAGHPAAVPPGGLQDKGNRYYFLEAMKLAPGEIYVSPFDLNIENGAIEQPLKPMIRVCMGIFNDRGQRIGIAVLNYLGQRILNGIRENLSGNLMQSMLLNADGYWLLSPDKSQEWAFMYEDRKSTSFAALYPEAWKTIQASSKGQFSAQEGDYTFSTIRVAPVTMATREANVRQWKIVCLTLQSTIKANLLKVYSHYISIFIGLLLLILFGAMTRARFVRSRELSREQLEKARQEAEDANRAKSDFLARMSHEIRTPMNAIIGLTHLSLKTELTPKQSDYLNKVSSSAQTLLAIINDILDFSKIEADRMEIDNVDFLLDDVLNNTVNMLGLQAEQKGLEFLLLVRSSVPNQLVGDPLRLGQVLLNLTGNAIKFTEAGEVILAAELVEETDRRATIRFSVKDTGIGIGQKEIDSLFQPFSQADGSITRRFGGTGLGLAICKRLVEKMGGTMHLKSEPGQGSEFSFTIPLGLQTKRDEYLIYPENIRGMRVLVVDDSKMSRLVLGKMFESFSFDVSTASNGKQAIQSIKENDSTNPYGLIVTDWRMPDMDGLELTQQIKGNRALNHIPKVIMLTAYGHEAIRHQAEQTDLDGFMLKPFNRSILFDTIMDIFGGGEYRRKTKQIAKTRTGVPFNVAGAKVLLAEDNEINQQVAKEILESAGIYVSIANNGRMALEMLSSGTYDLVLMDIQMPVMDGFQTVKAIRSTPQIKEIPVIAMTAHALVGDKEKSLLSGMNDHVTKPIDPDLLMEVLSKWLPKDVRPPAPPQPQEADNEPAFPDLPGIDVKTALNRLKGNQILYKKLLSHFVTECEKALTRLRTAAASGKYDQAHHIAHSLKGSAGNIGADDLHQILMRMETAFKKGQDIPRQLMDELPPECSRIREGILEAFPPPPETTCPDRPLSAQALKKLQPQLEELADRLEQHDIEAKTLFEALKPALAEVASKFTSELAARMDRFDFAGSSEMIENFSLQCPISENDDG